MNDQADWADVIREAYERRFYEFCHRTGLDPEDTNSVLEFEKEYEETEQP